MYACGNEDGDCRINHSLNEQEVLSIKKEVGTYLI
uniref:Uncharacterized protein n=1 Tax=Rhizophora mucronata TaxID=61149 RepID=A0A2P2QD86_RHIMU